MRTIEQVTRLTANDVRQLKIDVIRYSKIIGIDKIGFAGTDVFDELKQRLVTHREKGYESGFEEPDLDKRVTPKKVLPQAKSIIAIALAYPSKMKDAPRSRKGAYRGILCRASWGQDYHHILRERMHKLEQYLRERLQDVHIESMVDTGELSDRAVAERAGIGWSGKNTAIITKEFGSWVYLGEMLTSIPFEPDQPITESCGTCNKCVDACPTGALVQGGQLDSQKCIAFVTQLKNFVPMQYREKIGNRLYGCDTCQTVCPENKKKHFNHHSEMVPDPEVSKPLLTPLLEMSKSEYRQKFGSTASSWRGKKPIQRNAIIGLGNFRDVSAVPKLIKLLMNDARPAIRGTSAWSLGKIGGEKATRALSDALNIEDDHQVIYEIEHAQSLINHRQGKENVTE